MSRALCCFSAALGSMVVASLALAGGPPCNPAIPVSPPMVEIVLAPGQSFSLEKCVCLGAIPPKIDVCIGVDLTGSMGGEVSNLKAEIANVISTLRATGSDFRFALVTYEDYPASYNTCGYNAQYAIPGCLPFRVVAPIGSSDMQVQTGVQMMTIGDGRDTAESYARALWESAQPDSGINFRPDSLKLLVNFGDAFPHDCNLGQGLPGGCPLAGTTGVDPGRDGMAGTPDDIDFQSGALAAMIAANVKLLQVYSGPAIGSDPNILCAWQTWANSTGGSAVQINSDGSVPGGINLAQLILQLVLQGASIVEDVRLVKRTDCPLQITFNPPSRGPIDVTNGARVCFTETITVPPGFPPPPGGRLCCFVDAYADSALIGTQQVCVTINRPPTCNAGGPYNAECGGATTSIQLTGLGSSDPDNDPLTYGWTTTCPGATFDNANSGTPILTVPSVPGCYLNCSVTLTVSDGINPPVSCTSGVRIRDTLAPTISCPDPIFVDNGSRACGSTIDDWLNSATASDMCDVDVDIVNDAPDCGFPFGSTTTVTWTATDNCGHSASCSSTITVGPAPRASVSETGSLLVYSKVEVKWDDQGNLIQDTFISLLNDFELPVSVQLYFVNGDAPLPSDGVERAHPGWNWVDNQIRLTQNQPTYWSAATGLPAGVSPWSVLDQGNPPGRPDPENPGLRVLRGFIVAWAVNLNGHEIRWNHLSGDATLVNYADSSAWTYLPWAFAATSCVANGQEPLDCLETDANGVCCSAGVVPGRIDLDGFQYDYGPDRLLLDFFAVGIGLNGGGRVVTVDTDLTLQVLTADLRQDTTGPGRTKAKFDIWNANEVRFSGQDRCLVCWDQTLLSNYRNPNHFLRVNLQTDKGKARIDGLASSVCLNSSAHVILGVEARRFDFDGTDLEYSGANLVGVGVQKAAIQYDLISGAGGATEPPLFAPSGIIPKLELPLADPMKR